MTRRLILLILILLGSNAFGQRDENLAKCFPNKQDHQYVYDISQTLTPAERNELQQRLTLFEDSTSNVLAIVIVNTFCDYDAFTYSNSLANDWGLGRSDKENGILIVLKPKETSDDGKGEVRIEVGTGLQGAITDLVSGRIVDYEMIPEFKKGNYGQGLMNASLILAKIASGEISVDNYMGDTDKDFPIILIIIIVIILFASLSSRDNHGDYGRNGKRTSSGSIFWGGFGGGAFSGSGGGFGGFGGGGFSGGGAGGSW